MRTKMTNPLKPAETYTHTHTHTGSFCRVKNLISLIIATIFITHNVIGATINNGSKCDEGTLGSTGEKVELESVWEPNKINVKFYKNEKDTEPETVSCTYGETLNLPEQPTRRGYTFAGWEVLNPQAPITPTEPVNPGYEYGELCGIPNLDTSTDGNAYYSYTWTEYWGNKCRSTYANDLASYPCSETPDLAGSGEWKVEFSYGTIYGEASCNTTKYTKSPWPTSTYTVYEENKKPGNTFSKNKSTPSGDERNCWCRVTGFTVNPNPGEAYDYSNGAQCTVSSSAWVVEDNKGSADYCAGVCAITCAVRVRNNSALREVMFGAVGE